ncbi:MAG: hypothetical protein HQ490_04250 [Lutibacter sp.]|nr:hypothetical protein [Lutibacter sp.]
MKKIIFLLLFIATNSFVIFAQSLECITDGNDGPDPPGIYTYSTAFNEDLYAPVVFNIFYWVIRRDDGTTDFPIDENYILEAVANLNITFNELNVFFKYKGFENLDNDDLYATISLSDAKTYLSDNNYNTDNSLNVVVNGNMYYQGGGGFADYIGNFNYMYAEYLTIYQMQHEIGHNLGLKHTFQDYGNSACEHVTRDPNDIDDPNDPYDTYFNATTAGDNVVDTAAINSTVPGHDFNYSNCTYDINGSDCQDTPFDLNQVDLENLMNINIPRDLNLCRILMTPGQMVRIRETIEGYPNVFTLVSGTIADLYEPYSGEYYLAGPLLPEHRPLFQPGFNYRFVECCCNYPQPTDFNNTSFSYTNNAILTISKFETDYNSIMHPNHSAIQLDIEFPNNEQNVRKCYDNWNKAALGGSVTKFNDNLINTNITITPKDSLGINNPNLINGLQQGLYKIEKNFDDGSSQETIIFKGNNN